MKEKVRLGIIGLGARGISVLEWQLLPMTKIDIEVVAVCDIYTDRAEVGRDKVKEVTGVEPKMFTDYKKVNRLAEVDAIIIMTSWEDHIRIAIDAMENGKYVGMEVGGAYKIQDCFDLVSTYKHTKVPCMLLENCCYGRREMMILNIVKKGIFGEIVNCSGGYHHDLRDEITFGKENRHYRLRNYLGRNCENYPTHELGPISKILNINNGNRFISLSSTSSISKGLSEYVKKTELANKELLNCEFKQGDIITTVLKCEKGETVVITLDTTLPRPYSRGFTVRGTKGSYFEDTDSIFLDNKHGDKHFAWKEEWGNAQKFEDEFDHPIWKEYKNNPIGGHDGMDWLVLRAFVESVKRNDNPPIDVYDTATLMAVTALSEESIKKNGKVMDFPDFTNGAYKNRKDVIENKFSLHKIIEDNSISLCNE